MALGQLHLPEYLPREAADYARAVAVLAALFRLSLDDARRNFKELCAESPHAWRENFRAMHWRGANGLSWE